jgi:hypothetical protein
MNNLQEFAFSPNGDRWFLAKDDVNGETFVLHRANAPSGGHETRTSVHAFLNTRPFGPEREAMLAILGVADDRGDVQQENYTNSAT